MTLGSEQAPQRLHLLCDARRVPLPGSRFEPASQDTDLWVTEGCGGPLDLVPCAGDLVEVPDLEPLLQPG